MKVILKTVGENFFDVVANIEHQLPSLLDSYRGEYNVANHAVMYQVGPAKMSKEDPLWGIENNSKIIVKVVLFESQEEYEAYSKDYPEFINNKN